MANITSTKNGGENNAIKVDVYGTNHRKKRGYVKYEYIIIILTFLITIMGFLIRTWRIIREGIPIGFDGWFYLRYLKRDFFQGWIDLTELTRDPPGFTFIILIAENLFGYSGEPLMWSIYIFPQIISSIQLIIFFVLARRLTKSRTTGLLFVLYMSVMGLFVYRNQNNAPETFVLGLVPFVVFYILRYLETNDFRFMILGLLITSGIVMIHHLTTFMILVIWHILLPYDILYRRMKENHRKITKRKIVINIAILFLMDMLIILFWQYLLKRYPINFIIGSISNLFTPGEAIAPLVLMIFAVLIINAIAFSIFFYNFNKKKINIAIVSSSIIGIAIIFIVGMFYGAASPDQNLLSAFLMGFHAIVLAPLGAIGLVNLQKNNLIRSRMIRGWLFGVILIISVTAIFTIMSSFLARLALFIVSVGGLLATIAIVKIVSKVNKRKLKALTLITLSGCMALTLAYSHPKPYNNWGTQELFWEAEFSAVDYLYYYSEIPEHTIYNSSWPIVVDTDFRLAGILVGYLGIETIFESSREDCWLKTILFANKSDLETIVTNSSPLIINSRTDFILISRIMMEDGFHVGWAAYADDNDEWIIKFPRIDNYLYYNPFINRIYDTKISLMLKPNQLI